MGTIVKLMGSYGFQQTALDLFLRVTLRSGVLPLMSYSITLRSKAEPRTRLV